MIYDAYIKKVDEIIEDDITIEVNGIELIVFGGYGEAICDEGQTYSVELDLESLDGIGEYDIEVLSYPEKDFIRIGDTFAYNIKGLLTKEGILDAGILIESEELQPYEFLYGQYISLNTTEYHSLSLKKSIVVD